MHNQGTLREMVTLPAEEVTGNLRKKALCIDRV
jgi:hypothetical protein